MPHARKAMSVELLGPFNGGGNTHSVRVSCDECTNLQHAQGANPIFYVAIWTHRFMLCTRHLDELVSVIRKARSYG